MIKKLLPLIVLILILSPLSIWAQSPEPYGIVSIRVTKQAFHPSTPWKKPPEGEETGNALVVSKGLLLTTADMVKNATLIEARKFGRYPDYQAQVVLVDYEVDLALLKVPAPAFWKNLRPLPISTKPIKGRFTINRWRSNGRFEQGTAEVIEHRVSSSRYGTVEFPILRSNTNMTGLGWAEVLTLNGKVVGISTGHGKAGLHANYGPLLSMFLKASRRKISFDAFAHRGFSWQQLNQPALRKNLGLSANSPGVLIRAILSGGTGSKNLRKGDILLKLGNYVIDPEGQIQHPSLGPILFPIALNESLTKTIPAVILRKGKQAKIKLHRKSFKSSDYRVIPYNFDSALDFEVFGGLIVQEMTLNHLRQWGGEWQSKAPSRLVIEGTMRQRRKKGEAPNKVVFISQLLSDPINLGYEGLRNKILVSANGKPLHSLKAFRKAITTTENGFHILKILPGHGRLNVIFQAEELKEANKRIRERYGIPAK